MTPSVSVIIPTYNRAPYLPQCINSALAQREDGVIEVIVVDDGSTDDTAEVMRQFGPDVQYIQQPNSREGAARNNGARHAKGDFLAFLDSDDYWLAGKIAGDIERFRAEDQPALVYSRARNVDPGGGDLGVRQLASPQGDVFWQLARESFIPLSTVSVRRSAFEDLKGFREERSLSGTADWELWMRMAARWRVGFVDHAATCIRVHPRNMLSDSTWMERAMLSGVTLALQDEAVSGRVSGGTRSRMIYSHMYVTIALNAYATGNRRRSAIWLIRAVQAWPRQLKDPRFLAGVARNLLGQGAARSLRALRPRSSSGRSVVTQTLPLTSTPPTAFTR